MHNDVLYPECVNVQVQKQPLFVLLWLWAVKIIMLNILSLNLSSKQLHDSVSPL